MHKLIAPLRVHKTKNKLFSLNLNTYRNEHHMTLNKAKANFKEEMKEQILKLPTFSKVKLTYVLYPATKHLTDVGNVCTVVDKFFADALVELRKLPDDNYLYVPELDFRFGSIDRENPRVEIFIEEIE
jgi:hypothetical protein